MAEFRYRAIDPKGASVEGKMEEASAHRVATILEEQGYQVNRVDAAPKPRNFFPPRNRLSYADLELFNDQLTATVRGGLPLAPALAAVAADLHKPRLRRVMEDVRRDLESGMTLSEALECQADAFPEVYRAAVRAGEEAGDLQGVLSMLTRYTTRVTETRNAVIEALLYPAIVVLGCLFVAGLLLLYVMPAFGLAFEDMESTMPWFSRQVYAFSMFLQAHQLAIFAGMAAVLLGVFLVWRVAGVSASGRYAIAYCKLRTPLVKRLFATSAMARFTHTLGLLLHARAELIESLQLAAAVSGNAVLERAVKVASGRVAAGERISEALGRTGFFSHSYCWLLWVAEERGDVAESLLQLADTYEHSAERQARLLIWWIGPILILFIAVMLAAIAIAIYQPVLGLTSIGDIFG